MVTKSLAKQYYYKRQWRAKGVFLLRRGTFSCYGLPRGIRLIVILDQSETAKFVSLGHLRGLRWTGLGCYKEDGLAQNQVLLVPPVFTPMVVTASGSLIGACASRHEPQNKLDVPTMFGRTAQQVTW